MSELSPEDRDLLEIGGRDDAPGDGARDRVRRRLALRLGAAAGLGTATVATKTAAASAVTTKLVLVIAIVSAIGAGGTAIGFAMRTPPPAETTASTQGVAAHTPATASTAVTVAAVPSGSLEPGGAGTPLAVSAPPPEGRVAAGAPSSIPRTRPNAGGGSAAMAAGDGRTSGADGPANAAPRAPTDTRGKDALAEETRLLRDANAATRAGQPANALALLDEHARRFPRGVLAEEREAERVFTLCGAGRVEDGRAAAARFLSTYPRSGLAGRVRAACGGS